MNPRYAHEVRGPTNLSAIRLIRTIPRIILIVRSMPSRFFVIAMRPSFRQDIQDDFCSPVHRIHPVEWLIFDNA
jgi:hypothetical protein